MVTARPCERKLASSQVRASVCQVPREELAGQRSQLAEDIGRGFELDDVYRSGWTVVVATSVLSLLTWIVGYSVM